MSSFEELNTENFQQQPDEWQKIDNQQQPNQQDFQQLSINQSKMNSWQILSQKQQQLPSNQQSQIEPPSTEIPFNHIHIIKNLHKPNLADPYDYQFFKKLEEEDDDIEEVDKKKQPYNLVKRFKTFNPANPKHYEYLVQMTEYHNKHKPKHFPNPSDPYHDSHLEKSQDIGLNSDDKLEVVDNNQHNHQNLNKPEQKGIDLTIPNLIAEMQIDDDIQEVFKQKGENKNSYDLEKGLILDVKTFQKHFQFNNSEDQTIPVMASVKTLEQTSNTEVETNLLEGRPNLDLICVIDNSGSMSGSKIKNVQNTILYLIDMLNDKDRLSLILFNSESKQLCGLKKINQQNKSKLEKIVKSIKGEGGTDIASGMEKAFQILQNRKQKNQVSSIFLLSDGQDNESDQKIRKLLNTTFLPLSDECFTIHSFGFGNDHDGPLMQSIAQIKDGSFYYVERNDQVDEFFIDALGGLFSVVGQDINITVQVNTQNQMFQKFFQSSYISKTYGPMWKTVTKNEELAIKINQIFQGVSKDFIFEITVPKSEVLELQDFERNLELLNIQVTAIPLNPEYTTKVVKHNNLVLTLFTQYENVPQDSEINDNVEFNYLRVKAAESIEQAIKFADKNEFKEGQAVLSEMLKKIEKSHPNNQAKLQVIKQDLVQCQHNVQPQQYQNSGKFKLQQQCNNNYNQQSYAIRSNDIYQAPMQKQMVQAQQMFKQNQQQN